MVSYNDADQFGNTWHHRRWKDFLNLRDLCVIWGNNVNSEIYQKLKFSSDSWTCWVSSDSYAIWEKFNMNQLSNNHLLVEDEQIKKKLMSTEIGDHVQIKGMLVSYKNLNNGYQRASSITRNDTGNGACETIFITSFKLIKKANTGIRNAYSRFFKLTVLFLILYAILFCITPRKIKRAY